jgi:hypothetical protein
LANFAAATIPVLIKNQVLRVSIAEASVLQVSDDAVDELIIDLGVARSVVASFTR